MINDYRALMLARGIAAQPDAMVHSIGHDSEVKALTLGLTVTDLMYMFASFARSEPKLYESTVTDGVRPRESVG